MVFPHPSEPVFHAHIVLPTVRRLELTDGTWPLPVANADGTLPIPMAEKTSRISILKIPGSSGHTIYFDTIASTDGQHSGLGGGSAAAEDGTPKVIPEDGPTIPSPIPQTQEGPGPWTDGEELPKEPPKVPSAIPGMPGGISPWATGNGTIIKFGSGSNTVIHSMGSGAAVVVGSGATVVMNPVSRPTAAGKGGISSSLSIKHWQANGATVILHTAGADLSVVEG